MRVLFVCDDNRRASAMAAGLLYHEHRIRPIGGLVVASAGLTAGGADVDASVVSLLEDRGVDLGRKRARPVTAALVVSADLVVTMTAAQAQSVRGRYPEAHGRVFALGRLVNGIDGRPATVDASTWLAQVCAQLAMNGEDRGSTERALDVVDAREPVFAATLSLADRLLGDIKRLADGLWGQRA